MRVTIGARIKQARRQQGLNQAELSQLCGWSEFPARISNYERGKREPKSEDLRKLANALSVSIDWFYKSTDQTLSVQESRLRYGTANMVPMLSWDQVIPYLQNQALKQDIDSIPVPSQFGTNCFGLLVDGDSMESTQGTSFLHGSHIVVDPDADAQPNDYVLVKTGQDQIVFKQLTSDMGKCYLKPLNPRYPLTEMTDTMQVIGVIKINIQYFE